MLIEAHLVPDGHSTHNGSSGLENFIDELPKFEKKIECRAEIDRNGGTMYVHLYFKGEFQIECSRCLNLFKLPVSGDFRVIIKEKTGKSDQDEDSDLVDFYFDTRNDIIDISPAIYDEILVAMPLKPLCRAECEGISLTDADIHVDFGLKQTVKNDIDPRWDALRKIKFEKN